jgi:hypothetical protein
MRELLAIPERDRTDAQWDELNELEIQNAPGNRIGQSGSPGGGSGGSQGSNPGGGQRTAQPKKNRPRWTGNRPQQAKKP